MRELDKIKVRDVMRKEVTVVDGSIDVLEAMRTMKAQKTTSLIIKKRDNADEYGMVLFSDIAKQVIAKDRAPERVHVFEIMSKPTISVHPTMDIRYCARLFRKFGIRRAPVIEDHKVVGMISYYHLVLEALPELD